MKQFTWLLVATFVFAMSACGGKKSDKDKGDQTPAAHKDKGDKGGGAEFDEAKVKELSELDVPGFKRIEGGQPMKGMAMPNYEQETANDNGRKAFVMVNAQKCMMCQPMDLAKWKANENLKAMLPSIHKNNPNLVWDVEEIEAGGVKAISVYERSFVKDDKTTATSNGMTVYYNNGKNMLTIQISVRGGPPAKDEAELETLYPKDQMVAVAKTFLAAFAPKI